MAHNADEDLITRIPRIEIGLNKNKIVSKPTLI